MVMPMVVRVMVMVVMPAVRADPLDVMVVTLLRRADIALEDFYARVIERARMELEAQEREFEEQDRERAKARESARLRIEIAEGRHLDVPAIKDKDEK